MNYKKLLKVALPLFFILMFFALRASLAKEKAETDYLSAFLAYNAWNQSESLDTVYLTNLKTYIKKHPELSARYEQPMLQRFVAEGETKLSLPIIEKALKKVVERPTYYDRFGSISLHIANGMREKALMESLMLKNDLTLDTDFWSPSKAEHRGSSLFAFNLLRIAMLYQELGRHSEEYAAWKEFKIFAGWEEGETALDPKALDLKAFASVERHFNDQGVALKDYISYREKQM